MRIGLFAVVAPLALAACALDTDYELGAGGGAGGVDAWGVPFATGPGAGAEAGVGGTGGAALPCDVGGVPGSCLDVSDCFGDWVSVPGHCPGPAQIQCCVPWNSVACDPDAAPLPNEGFDEASGMGGCPPGMLRVASFCVDVYEASLVLADAPGSFSPFQHPGAAHVRAVSIAGAIPQAFIDGEEAADACAAAGKRLCSDTEWLRACRGPAGHVYPYGDVLEPGVCNDFRAEHPAVELYGTTDPWIWSALDNACLDQLPDSLDPAGANPGCVSDEGVYDMMGNLHEWTSDPAGTFRGGFFVDTVVNGPGCLYATTAHNTLHWDYSTGFRCCADP